LVTVDCACKKYLNDAENGRKLQPSTLRKHRYLCKQITSFAETKGWETVKSWNLERTAEFRNSWNELNLGAVKKLERLRQLLQFWLERGWIEKNYAKQLGNPQVRRVPTLPYTKEEMALILAACERWGTHCQGERGKVNPLRIRALVLLMRYSGLRIQDAVTIGRDRIIDGKIFLYTQKTGTPVWCPLPPFVLEALGRIPVVHHRYYFWRGESTKEGATKNWQKGLKSVFLSAGIPEGHSHRFRDTFAVELLLQGVPIERVSILLGHGSVKITEKHYAPWVKARQEQLEADVRRTWEGQQSGETAKPKPTLSIQ
jgi:integrase